MNSDQTRKHTDPDLLNPDAGVDPADAKYAYEHRPDRNAGSHDLESAAQPDPDAIAREENIVDRQLGTIGRVSG